MSDAVRPAALAATELLAAYRSGTLSPTEVLDDVVRVVRAREPELNALTVHGDDLETELARASAAARDSTERWRRGQPVGPLDGVPATVKENLSRAGVPLVSGSAAAVPVVPARSSPVVERLEESGAVLIASTVMPDWGMLSSGVSSLHGVSRSPWDPTLTTGGSSAGAGAAAAAGYGPLHVGTDIGGSVRLPGTWLGLATLKPSAGRVPLDVPYLGRVAGPMTRTVGDLALLLGVLARPDARDWTSLPPEDLSAALASAVARPHARSPLHGMRVGLQTDAGHGPPVDPRVAAAVDDVARLLAEGGAEVTPLAPFVDPEGLEALDRFWRVRLLAELDALPAGRADLVLPFVRRWAEAARRATGTDVLRAYEAVGRLQQATVAATLPYDAVVSPVTPVLAFPAEWPMPWGEHDEAMSHIGFTAPYNLSGQPAGTLNVAFTDDGRAVGVQVAGRRFDDVGVVRVLAWLEAHRPPAAAPRWPVRS